LIPVDSWVLGNKMSTGEEKQVQVRFISKIQTENEVPDTSFQVPAKLARYGLSEIVNHLLGQDPPLPYDFLIENVFLRTSLATYLSSKGLSGESELILEYIEAFPAPNEQKSYPHPDWVSALDGSSVKGRIFSGCYDGVVRVFDSLNTDKAIAVGVGHTGPIKSLRVLSSTSTTVRLVSGSKDKSVRVWSWNTSTKSCTPVAIGVGHQDSVETVAVCPTSIDFEGLETHDNNKFASGGWDKSILIWDAPPFNEDATASSFTGKDSSSTNSKKRKMVSNVDQLSAEALDAVYGGDNIKPLLSTSNSCSSPNASGALPTISPTAVLDGHTQAVTTITWPTRHVVYSGSYDRSIRQWDVETQRCVSNWAGSKVISQISFSLDKNLLASADQDKFVRIWDPRINNQKDSSVIKSALRSHTAWVTSVQWCNSSFASPHQLASCSHDGTVKLWDIRASIPLHTIEAHSDKALCLDWHTRDLNAVNVQNKLKKSKDNSGSSSDGSDSNQFTQQGLRLISGGADKKINEVAWSLSKQ
jgi:ribosome biogenesis protein YTM1